jgi:cytochrome P450
MPDTDTEVAPEQRPGSREYPPVDELNLLDPLVLSDPFEFYHAVQSQCPVYKLPQNNLYLISKYADLDRVLRDHENFANTLDRTAALQGENAKLYASILREKGWEHQPVLQRSDPPNHTRYRKIINGALNMKQVRNLQPHLVEVANQLIDAFIDRGTCDFINEFSLPFPGIIIAELIGLDAKQYKLFKTWADNLQAVAIGVLSPEEIRQAAELEVEMQHFVAKMLEDRRKEPRDDMLTGLVMAYEDTEPLTMGELQNMMHQLIAGGYETTTSAINHGVWQMIRFPEVAKEVRDDRSLMRNFIDESLRWESPVQGLYRQTTRDVEINGTLIPKGAMCTARYGAANRDPEMFPNADQFDIHRDNANMHLGFGAAVHVCPGAMLARAELTTAYNAILDRMENLELARPMPFPVHKPNFNQFPVKEFTLKFQKRATAS